VVPVDAGLHLLPLLLHPLIEELVLVLEGELGVLLEYLVVLLGPQSYYIELLLLLAVHLFVVVRHHAVGGRPDRVIPQTGQSRVF
jgi:hypothetical protein